MVKRKCRVRRTLGSVVAIAALLPNAPDRAQLNGVAAECSQIFLILTLCLICRQVIPDIGRLVEREAAYGVDPCLGGPTAHRLVEAPRGRVPRQHPETGGCEAA